MPELPESERKLCAQIAANTSWGNTIDRLARTEPGRRAAAAKFEQQVDPEGILTPVERAKRAENLRKAHMQRLALKSAQVRRLRKQARDAELDGGAA